MTRGCAKPKRAHLEYLPSMSGPCITQPPDAVFVAIEHPDLAINGPRRTAITVGVECHCLDQIVMAMLHNKLKLSPFLRCRGLSQSRCHACLSDIRGGWKITFRCVEAGLVEPSSSSPQPTREALRASEPFDGGPCVVVSHEARRGTLCDVSKLRVQDTHKAVCIVNAT